MLKFLSDRSVGTKLGSILLLLLATLVVFLFLYISNAQAQQGNAIEVNQAGFLRALSVRAEVLVREVAGTEVGNATALHTLEDKVTLNQKLLDSLVGLYGSSQTVERDEFTSYLANFRTSYPDVTLIAYIPRIPSAQRPSLEDQLQNEGITDFRLFEIDATGTPVRAALRREHFPYIFVEPASEASSLLGFDAASNPAQLAALEQARDTGQTIATTSVQLIGNTKTPTVLVFEPIYIQDQLPTTIDSRRESLQGFVVLALDITGITDSVAAQLPSGIAVLKIEDVTNGDPGQLLFESPSDVVQDGSLTIALPIYGRNWAVTFSQPAESDMAASLAELQEVNLALQQRIIGLRDGSEKLGLEGLDRHSGTSIIPAFEQVEADYVTLNSSIEIFINAATDGQSAALAQQVDDDAETLFTDANDFVGALQNELESETQAVSRQALLLAAIAAVITLILIAALAYLLAQLNSVAGVAQEMAQGNFNARTSLTSRDEIGQIGIALNQMATQLQDLIGSLETSVVARTRDLQTVLDVNSQIATILQPDRLLQDVLDLTKERFGLYHAHIYLLDDSEKRLVLTAGAGYVGRQMVAEKRSIDYANLQSIVATAARSRKSVNVSDVLQSPTFLPHPLLPDTRSELAVPLVARGQVVGVLDVQSDVDGKFDAKEIVSVLEATANQIAIAISNARLYEVAERSSRHQQALGTITQKMQTANNIDELLQTAVQELGKALRVPHSTIELRLPTNGEHTRLNPTAGRSED